MSVGSLFGPVYSLSSYHGLDAGPLISTKERKGALLFWGKWLYLLVIKM